MLNRWLLESPAAAPVCVYVKTQPPTEDNRTCVTRPSDTLSVCECVFQISNVGFLEPETVQTRLLRSIITTAVLLATKCGEKWVYMTCKQTTGVERVWRRACSDLSARVKTTQILSRDSF